MQRTANPNVALIALFTAAAGSADALLVAWLFESTFAMVLCASALIALTTCIAWALWRH